MQLEISSEGIEYDSEKIVWNEDIGYAEFHKDEEGKYAYPCGLYNNAEMDVSHLPDKVVDTPFSLVLISSTSNIPRLGGWNVALRFGDRDNPDDLTLDEREYVAKSLRLLAGNFYTEENRLDN